MRIQCHCGEVRLEFRQSVEFIHQCNCTLCSKLGAKWGYLDPETVRIEGQTSGYRRRDKDDPSAEMRFCMVCGLTSHFVLTESAGSRHGNTMMGVNMALTEPADLSGVQLRFPDGRNWDGEGEFGYVKPHEVID